MRDSNDGAEDIGLPWENTNTAMAPRQKSRHGKSGGKQRLKKKLGCFTGSHGVGCSLCILMRVWSLSSSAAGRRGQSFWLRSHDGTKSSLNWLIWLAFPITIFKFFFSLVMFRAGHLFLVLQFRYPPYSFLVWLDSVTLSDVGPKGSKRLTFFFFPRGVQETWIRFPIFLTASLCVSESCLAGFVSSLLVGAILGCSNESACCRRSQQVFACLWKAHMGAKVFGWLCFCC